jgi:hypothetical protein
MFGGFLKHPFACLDAWSLTGDRDNYLDVSFEDSEEFMIFLHS